MSLESKRQTGLSSEGEQALEKLSSFWERHGQVILGAVGVVAVVAVGSFFYLRGRAEQESAAAGKLAEASLLYWQGEYQRSSEIAKQVSTQYASTPSGADAHRVMADDAFWNGDFKTAIAEYRRYLEKAPAGLLAAAGRRSLAYALESDREFAEAAKTYESLVGQLDRSSSAEFLMAAARCYQALGQPARALEPLRRLDAEFGESSYSMLARTRIAELEAASR